MVHSCARTHDYFLRHCDAAIFDLSRRWLRFLRSILRPCESWRRSRERQCRIVLAVGWRLQKLSSSVITIDVLELWFITASIPSKISVRSFTEATRASHTIPSLFCLKQVSFLRQHYTSFPIHQCHRNDPNHATGCQHRNLRLAGTRKEEHKAPRNQPEFFRQGPKTARISLAETHPRAHASRGYHSE